MTTTIQVIERMDGQRTLISIGDISIDIENDSAGVYVTMMKGTKYPDNIIGEMNHEYTK